MDIDKLTASIKQHEGTGPVRNNRFFPYKDSQGFLSIGYGRCLDKNGISQEEANGMLATDIQSCIGEAQTQPWWPHVADNDARSRACLEMLYNLGLGGFSTFKDAIQCLCNDDFNGAGVNFLQSLWAKQIGARSEILAKMIMTGSDA